MHPFPTDPGTIPRRPTLPRPTLAVVGGGIAGLGAAWLLRHRFDVTLYEQEARLGGHSNTVDAVFPDGTCFAVDTGFIVYNTRNYPDLTALFETLAVPTQPSDMSFGASIGGGTLEWAGDNLSKLFGQRRNLLRPRFHRMLLDILRFNREARLALRRGGLGTLSLGDFLGSRGYAPELTWHYLLPMGAAIWSAPPAQMLEFPAESFLRFYDNHGLLELRNRPAWRTVTGGSRRYVTAMARDLGPAVRLACVADHVFRSGEGVSIIDRSGDRRRFDQVVMACHADQALAVLADPDPEEAACLGSFRYQSNEAVLHRDTTLMPRRQSLWSSWNYLSDGSIGQPDGSAGRVSVTYWMNRLQGLDRRYPLFVSLNPLHEPDPRQVFMRIRYAHPMFDAAALAAQDRLSRIQGVRQTWFCGSWCGYGFHEDALGSAISVALALGVQPPWRTRRAPAAIASPPAPYRDGPAVELLSLPAAAVGQQA